MSVFKVNDGTQVKHEGVLYQAGETFEADPADIASVAQYITPVEPKPEPEPKAEPKAKPSAPNKARKSSPNKTK